ncbi:MAG: hypothetical protein M3R72_01285 [Bacteroidota bacterium]|nr:hypothetical protein [Bacteroidota bacterium]
MQEEDEHRLALAWSYQTLNLPDMPFEKSNAELEAALAEYLNRLVVEDFNKLVAILYRIDVEQEKAVAELAEYSKRETAGETLARLIINRQKQKLRFRKLQ